MPLFDSITLAFGTAGTGGFGVLNSSIGGYNTFCQVVITVFMALFGVNFNIYFLLLFRKFKTALKSSELWIYFGTMGAASVAIAINIRNYFDNIFEAFHHAAFQVSSVMTTTGYSTTDFDKWPEFSRTILLMIMCIGACAGSTGGGFKLTRVILLVKYAKKTLRSLTHPRSVKTITFEGQRVPDEAIRGTIGFFIIYVIIFAVTLLIVSADKNDLVTDFSSIVATLNNIGPGLGKIGPTGNFSSYNALSKIVFIINMLLGRLEIFPLICLVTPSIHKKHFRKKL
jgi:trk system potassium uptake protein TrkH